MAALMSASRRRLRSALLMALHLPKARNSRCSRFSATLTPIAAGWQRKAEAIVSARSRFASYAAVLSGTDFLLTQPRLLEDDGQTSLCKSQSLASSLGFPRRLKCV